MEEDDDNCPDCGYIGKGEDFAYHDCRFVLCRRIAALEAEKAVNDAFRKEAAKLADDYLSLNSAYAALAAEKAERERQEPVAWAWDDALGCMHVHCGSRRPHWVDDECSDSMRAELSLRPLYAHPLALREPTEDECREILARNR